MFTEEFRKISEKYTPKSNKILINFREGEKTNFTPLVIPGNDKINQGISIDDLHKYYKDHPYLGDVISIGSAISQTEPDLKNGSVVYLRGIPSSMDYVLLEGKIYYAIDLNFYLCYRNE